MPRSRPISAERRPAACVRGAGVAALTCARLLAVQGWEVRLDPGDAAARPVTLRLGAATAGLLAALWNDPDILAGAHATAARAVRWGDDAPAVQPEAGLVIDAAELAGRLAARLHLSGGEGGDWTIDARRAAPHAQCFGTRAARTAAVALRWPEDDAACVMEAVPAGWLFLLPRGDRAAVLQFIAPAGPVLPQEAVLGQSRLVAAAIAAIGPWSPALPAMAAATLPAAASGRLAAGEAALSFDPIAGDGVGHALRGAVLVATSLDRIARGAPPAPVLADYDATLRAAMAHHLGLCLRHYRAAAPQAVWAGEIAAMEAGQAALTAALAA